MSEKFNASKYAHDFKKNHYDRISLLVKKGSKDILSEFAKNENLSLNAFIKKALKYYIGDISFDDIDI